MLGFLGVGGLSDTDELTYPFTGEHQAGIVTPAQDRMHFASLDMVDDATCDDLIDLLQRWTTAARRLTLGGEVSARGAFGLTLRCGFGRSLFTKQPSGEESADSVESDRVGISDRMPTELSDLPVLVNDFLIPERSGGDLCIQACANDPQVASHAIRNLTRMAMGVAVLKWSQIGFGRTSSTSQSQKTPRNLFGQKDGTMNLKVEEQERVTGRDKVNGAPLTGGGEFDEPDFSAHDQRGLPVIDERSHVFRVHLDNNGGIRMLCRGYNLIDGNDDQGRLDAGLFFIAFTRTPERFAKVHQNLARDDMFIEYLKTTSSSVFLVPLGIGEDGYAGQGLFES